MPETPKSTKSLKKALFLDRDGVVINYIPYLSSPEQVQIPEGAGKALQYWKNRDYLLILITNPNFTFSSSIIRNSAFHCHLINNQKFSLSLSAHQ